MCKSTSIVQSIRKIISNLNNVTQADIQLVIDTGFSLNTLFTAKEIANLSPSVLSAFKNSIFYMQFYRETARIILSKLFNAIWLVSEKAKQSPIQLITENSRNKSDN